VTGNSPTASSTTQGSSAQQRTATARNPYGTSPTGQVYPLGTQQGQGCNVHPERIGSSQIYHHRQSSPLCLRFSPERLHSPDAVKAVLYSVQIFGGIRPFSAFFQSTTGALHLRRFTHTAAKKVVFSRHYAQNRRRGRRPSARQKSMGVGGKALSHPKGLPTLSAYPRHRAG